MGARSLPSAILMGQLLNCCPTARSSKCWCREGIVSKSSFQLLEGDFEWRFKFGVPYGSRTRVAAVKEKRPIVIQRNLAAGIALYRTYRTHRNAYSTVN